MEKFELEAATGALGSAAFCASRSRQVGVFPPIWRRGGPDAEGRSGEDALAATSGRSEMRTPNFFAASLASISSSFFRCIAACSSAFLLHA